MHRHATLVIVLLLAALIATGCPSPPAGVPEEVIRHNILGTAYLGQQNWSDAEAEFRKSAKLRPSDPLPLNNAAVALIQQGDTLRATEALEAALVADPDHPQAHYNLALILRNDGKFEEAARHLEVVAAFDPRDLLTQYHLASVLSRIGRDDEAERAFRLALRYDPTHVSTLYGLGRFLLQKGRSDEGAELIALSQEIRSRSGLDTAVGSQYGEQGPYAMGIDYPGDALAAPAPIPFRLVAGPVAESGSGTPGSLPWTLVPTGPEKRATFVFADGAIQRLSGEMVAPAPPEGEILELAAGDIDNDSTVEMIALLTTDAGLRFAVLRAGDESGWTWEEPGAFSRLPDREPNEKPAGHDLALVDREHDGDLDLVACWSDSGGPGCLVATNDGSGRFEVRPSSDHGFEPAGNGKGTMIVAFSDVDNDRDIDLLLAGPSGLQLFSNQRDGTFDELPAIAGNAAVRGTESLELADVNKDGFMDLVLGGPGGLRLLRNHRGTFHADDPLAPGSGRATVGDLDNDGFLDIVQAIDAGLAVHRNLGMGQWDAGGDVIPANAPGSIPLVALDTDADGDLDLVTRGPNGRPMVLDNDGGNANGWIEIGSAGVGDNSFGIGAKVELMAGALRQKFEITRPVPLHAGLGSRTNVESIRHVWPSGVLQDEVRQAARGAVLVTQLDRKGTSCPLLYAHADGAWRFVTDFLGGSAVGYQQAPGRFGTPDTDEYVKIPGGLSPDADGRLRLRLNNQLEEVIWFDKAELLVVDHPRGTEVFPNERLMPAPPYPAFELFVSGDLRPIRSARGVEDDADLTELLAQADGRFVSNFEQRPFKGYAEPHTLELDLGPFPDNRRIVLLMDGWIDYADSSSNVAAHQAGARLLPPRLLIADGKGGFTGTGHLMGFPAGLPKTLTVELSGLFPTADHRVRIETSMRIYWDRARTLIGGGSIEPVVRRLAPLAAELRFGGFPDPLGPGGPTPLAYDPNNVSPRSTWKAHTGVYTAFGDVLGLIDELDDRFVTTRNGDEIELIFQAPPPPAKGQIRSYLLFADGFGKDMDPNSAAADEVGPIPFHGMQGYPYTNARTPAPASDGERAGRRVHPSPHGWPGALPQALSASRTAKPPE